MGTPAASAMAYGWLGTCARWLGGGIRGALRGHHHPRDHYCMGGLEIDVDASCISGDWKMVKGLYMVGDVAGDACDKGQAWHLALGLLSRMTEARVEASPPAVVRQSLRDRRVRHGSSHWARSVEWTHWACSAGD